MNAHEIVNALVEMDAKDFLKQYGDPDVPTRTVRPNGTVVWRNAAGQLHRRAGPAMACANGYRAWYVNGKLHREDGPAIEREDGYRAWYVNGLQHRKSGPAVVRENGTQEWWIRGERIR